MKKIVVTLMFGTALLWADNALVLEEKCNANDAQACFKLGKKDKACDLGLVKACMEYGDYIYEYDTRNRETTISYYKKACDLGNMKGCQKMLYNMPDNEERLELYRKYCFDDEIEVMCAQVIDAYDDKELRASFARNLFDLIPKKCNEGDAEKCEFLGRMYLFGKAEYEYAVYGYSSFGLMAQSKNTETAREFFQKACDFGDTKTCKKYELTQDTNKLKTILEKACSSGNQNACPRLGELYFEEGKNAGKDAAKAKELYTKSCDLNSADGCYKIAVYYNVGRGVSQDINKAKELYKKACELKNESACSNFERLSK